MSHLLCIGCEYIAEMSCEHVSLFHRVVSLPQPLAITIFQVLTRCFKSSQPPSIGQLRTRRKSDSGSSVPPRAPIDLRGIGSM